MVILRLCAGAIVESTKRNPVGAACVAVTLTLGQDRLERALGDLKVAEVQRHRADVHVGIHIVRIALHGREELTVGRDDILLRERNQTEPVVQRCRVRPELNGVLTDYPRQLNAAQVEVDARQVGVGIGAQRLASESKPKEDDCLLRRLRVALACREQLLPLQNRKVDVAARLVLTRRDAVAEDPLRARGVALFQLQVAFVGFAPHELCVDGLCTREGIRRCRRIALLREHQAEVKPAVRVTRIQLYRQPECRLGPLQSTLVCLVRVGVEGSLPCGLQSRNALRLDLFGRLHPLYHHRGGLLGPLHRHLLGCTAGHKQQQRHPRRNSHQVLHRAGLLHG